MIVVLVIFILTGVLQIPDLVRKKYRKELYVFLILYIPAFILCLLYSLDFKLPSVYKGIAYLLDEVLNLHYPMN